MQDLGRIGHRRSSDRATAGSCHQCPGAVERLLPVSGHDRPPRTAANSRIAPALPMLLDDARPPLRVAPGSPRLRFHDDLDLAPCGYGNQAESKQARHPAPESILNQLPRDPHLWELAAGTMATSGHPPTSSWPNWSATHPAPSVSPPDSPPRSMTPTWPSGWPRASAAKPDQIAAASQRYGLTPAETAEILRDERAPMTQAVAVLGQLCSYDDDAVTAAWRRIEPTPDVTPTLPVEPVSRITSIGGADIGTAEELLAVLPPARLSATPPLLKYRYPIRPVRSDHGDDQDMNALDDLLPHSTRPDDGGELLTQLVAAVDFLRRGASPGLTVWAPWNKPFESSGTSRPTGSTPTRSCVPSESRRQSSATSRPPKSSPTRSASELSVMSSIYNEGTPWAAIGRRI